MEPLSANDPRTIGEFRLHAQLGAGGMGQVYLGFSPAGRAVAVKVIHPQFARDQEFLRRFSHEVAAASAVGGMYTAPVVDYDLQGSMPWLATAYVPGPTLSTFITKHGPLPETALWRLAAGLAEALRTVHAKGLIHRDLKPANVLLADSGPHVIDFGISRASSSMTQLTSAGMAIGTPGYMSPEQAQVHPVGPASDMFSLGCVLAFAATGTPPFHGDNPATVLFQIVSVEPDLSAISPLFRQVVQACLKKDPAQRPMPGQLNAMINQLGPAAPVTLGSFWAEDVARIIATERAAATPSGLTPFAPTGTSASGGTPSTSASGGTPRTPGSTGLGTPAPGSGPPPISGPTAAAASAAERAAAALAGTPGQAAGSGHAPMISDGYFAAAQRPSAPSVPPVAGSPQSYAAQQPYIPQQAPGQRPPGSVPPRQAPTGRGAPYSGLTPPYTPQPPTHPRSPYQAQQPYPGQPQQVGGHRMARRRPTAADVPPKVRMAIGFMYAGCAAMALSEIVNFIRYLSELNAANDTGALNNSAASAAIAGIVVFGLIFDGIGLGCWIWLAIATRQGQGWTRVVATVLLGIYTLSVLITITNNHNAASVITALLVWAIGIVSVIYLWSTQAREFFLAWRKP